MKVYKIETAQRKSDLRTHLGNGLGNTSQVFLYGAFVNVLVATSVGQFTVYLYSADIVRLLLLFDRGSEKVMMIFAFYVFWQIRPVVAITAFWKT